jgi:hypothetical protein
MKTAFATPHGNFEYKVVPMGLISSAHYFQQALEGIMRNHGILYERLAYDAPEFDSRDDAMTADSQLFSSQVVAYLARAFLCAMVVY